MFASDRAKPDVSNLYSVNADGTGDVTQLTDSPEIQFPASWHPSGKFLVFQTNRAATTGLDLMILPMEGDGVHGWTPGKPTVFVATPATDVDSVFSPDGRWIAYCSDELNGTYDVYVRPFPGPGGPWRVSTEGGCFPVWSPTGFRFLGVNVPYAIHPDGKRLAIIADQAGVVQDHVVFVFHFFEYLWKIAPGKK